MRNGRVMSSVYRRLCWIAEPNPLLYRRLKDQGKPDKVAHIAAARRLLLIAHAIYKSCRTFRTVNEKEG